MSHRACNKCGTADCDLRVCGKCKHVRYCSVECQKADWSSHKKQCKAPTVPTAAPATPAATHNTQATTAASAVPPNSTATGSRRVEPAPANVRREIGTRLASTFVDALSKDLYPLQDHERVFGVVMEKRSDYTLDYSKIPVGTLVFYCWIWIFKCFVEVKSRAAYVEDDDDDNDLGYNASAIDKSVEEFKKLLADAVTERRVPQVFREWVQQYVREDPIYGSENRNAYIVEMDRRGYDSIDWETVDEWYAKIRATYGRKK